MPNHSTFEIEPISRLIGRYIGTGRWIDPFARTSRFAKYCEATNDLDPAMPTTHHMEALAFLESFAPASVDGVLFDPPYSPRQIAECYRHVGREVHTQDTQTSFYGDRKRAAARCVRPGGIAISFGWNSAGFGLKNEFDIIEVLLVSHGSAHNDTIVTVERKRLGMFDTKAA
jgi:hypothetical protein